MRDLLNKYFRGETTKNETTKVVDWFEESDENHAGFLYERQIWDATVCMKNEDKHVDYSIKKKASFKYKLLLGYAASLLLFIIAGASLFIYAEKQNIAMQTVIVPAGQRVNLILADGSSVWLNSNTTLTYPANFNRKKREVSIKGEGYFNVKHMDNSPFVVHTDNYSIEVLGTAFNVNAYAGYSFETALFEGSINIVGKNNKINVLLNQNERFEDKNGKLVKKIGFDKTEYMWQKGILSFNDEPIADVLNQLSAYYNKNIVLENGIHNEYHCTAKFLYNDGLDYILKVLQRDLHYTIVEDSTNNCIHLK